MKAGDLESRSGQTAEVQEPSQTHGDTLEQGDELIREAEAGRKRAGDWRGQHGHWPQSAGSRGRSKEELVPCSVAWIA